MVVVPGGKKKPFKKSANNTTIARKTAIETRTVRSDLVKDFQERDREIVGLGGLRLRPAVPAVIAVASCALPDRLLSSVVVFPDPRHCDESYRIAREPLKREVVVGRAKLR